MNIVMTILGAILVFGAIIFVHELGHFLAAKASKIKVNEFAIGMGPRLIHFKRGETEYSLRLLPIGGFTAMEGEDEESNDPRSFQNAPIGNRMVVIIAGAVLNLALGFFVILGLTATQESILTRQIAGFPEDITITQESGLEVGDTIIAFNGRRMYITDDIIYELYRVENATADLLVLRDGQRVLLENVRFQEALEADGSTTLLPGFYVNREEATFGNVLKQSALETVAMARQIYISVFDLFTGRVPINQLSGPVGIVTIISEVAAVDFSAVFYILAMISINLGVVNMLPLPALDGGRFMLLLIEGIFHKSLKPRHEAMVHFIGIMLLFGLMLYVTFNDVSRLFTRG